jgi:photosynthetic reaction center cytochrome c subunit
MNLGDRMKKLTRLRSRGLILALTAATGVLLAFTWTGHVSAQAPAAAKPGTAGAAFKNVTTGPLKGLTVDDFMAAMGVISADLGLDCSDCHPGAGSDKVDWVFDTPQKKTARKMIEMVGAINKANFGGAQMVTCWTCHHGREIPGTTITLDKLYSAPNDEKDDIVLQGQGEPTGAQVIDKYIAALGGAQKVNALTSFIATGTSKGYEALGGGGSFQIFSKAPDQRTTQITFKDHPERGDSIRAFDGKTGWVKQPRAAVPEFQLTGSELNGAKVDAMMAFPGQIKTFLTGLRTNTTDIGDSDVQVVQGSGPGGHLVTLYFDKKTNLLVRMVRYSQSPVGRVPTQVDYADYRDVNGIKFPFQYTFSWLDGKDSFVIQSVKTNVPIDPAVFGKPALDK